MRVGFHGGGGGGGRVQEGIFGEGFVRNGDKESALVFESPQS